MTDRWENWFQPGEELIWQGAPSPGYRNILASLFLSVFGIPFLGAGLFASGMGLGYLFGFATDWERWHIALGFVVTAFGIPFIAVGAGLVFGPWVYQYLRPTRIRYALSEENGYIANRMWKRNMVVLPIRPDARIETEEHRDGSMDIWFHFENYRDSEGDKRTEKKGFESLADGHEVYRLIREIQARQESG